MAEGVLNRLAQERAVGAFLDSASAEPCGLVDIRSRAELGLRLGQPDR
jgi:hypothetical protein